MNDVLTKINDRMNFCTCDSLHHSINLKVVEIEHGALFNVVPYLKSKSYQNVSVICDENTFKAAGERLLSLLEASGLSATLWKVSFNELGEVTADEQSLIEGFLNLPLDTEIFLAVGSGTLHDIVRFVSFHRNKPFLSVPTASSVDGFASAGSPLILKGIKQTIQLHAPEAVFADLDILTKAPQKLTAAGFGDILGKFTSLADWKLSHLLNKEPYCKTSHVIMSELLERCVANVNEIANSTPKGIKILMEALIESGLVMMILGYSRPASGGEHHVSHFWEMAFLKRSKRQILHGAKVGVATTYVVDCYKNLVSHQVGDFILQDERKKKQIVENWHQIQSIYQSLPEADELRDLLRKVGGPSTINDIGIDEALLNEAFMKAHTLRDRYTGLRMMNENGLKVDKMRVGNL